MADNTDALTAGNDVFYSNLTEAYGENMTSETTKESKSKPEVEIGFGKNYYYGKDFDNPVREYFFGSYLEFSLYNKELLNYIYRYFNYDTLQRETLSPAKGWLIPGASVDARRPNVYFKSEKLLKDFLNYLYPKVKLVEIKSKTILSTKNHTSIIRSKVS